MIISGCSSTKSEQEQTEAETETENNTQETSSSKQVLLVPTLDYVAQEDGSLELSVLVEVLNGSFTPDLSVDQFTFGEGLENAQNVEIDELSDDQTSATILMNIDQGDLDINSLQLKSSMNIASNAILDADGNALADDVDLDFTLVNQGEERASSTDTSEYTLLPYSHTIVIRLKGDGTKLQNVKDIFSRALRECGFGGLLVVDFTDCSSLPWAISNYISIMVTSQKMEAWFVNFDPYSPFYYYSNGSNELVQIAQGDDSLIDYSSEDVFGQIMRLVETSELMSADFLY
jgi:hypothetical protein